MPIKTDRKTLSSDYKRSASESNNRKLIKDKSSGSVDTQLKKYGNYNEVKSRYLEPKRQSSNGKEPLKMRAFSSSGSSRTSSPVILNCNRCDSSNQLNKKTLSDSITMSRDSLASPAKKPDKLQSNKNGAQQIDHERLSADSLGGSSLHSSVITNKTISQESLIKPESRKSNDINTKINSKTTANQIHHTKPHPQIAGKNAQLKVCTALISQTSSSTLNSSTPSSMTVKSYLSSSNSINSPRDVNQVKGRLTTPATQLPLRKSTEPKPLTKSFLSARSRQILAQKKSLSHSDSSKSVPAVIKDTSLSVANAVNKSNSTSNMLKGKSKKFPTTLHLRKTAKLSLVPQQSISLPSEQHQNSKATTNHSLMNPTKSSALKMVAQNNKLNRENRVAGGKMVTTLTKSNSNRPIHDISSDCRKHNDIIINSTGEINIDESDSDASNHRIESKLERSSTFCKERSDINTDELQAID